MVLGNTQCSRPARNTGRRHPASVSRLLTVSLSLTGVLAALAGAAVGRFILGLALGPTGVGGLLGALLRNGLLATLLGGCRNISSVT